MMECPLSSRKVEINKLYLEIGDDYLDVLEDTSVMIEE